MESHLLVGGAKPGAAPFGHLPAPGRLSESARCFPSR
jgi:hypothetical protein